MKFLSISSIKMGIGGQVFNLDIAHEAMIVNSHGTTTADTRRKRSLTISACITPL